MQVLICSTAVGRVVAVLGFTGGPGGARVGSVTSYLMVVSVLPEVSPGKKFLLVAIPSVPGLVGRILRAYTPSLSRTFILIIIIFIVFSNNSSI